MLQQAKHVADEIIAGNIDGKTAQKPSELSVLNLQI